MTTSRLGVYLSEDVLDWVRERARQENRSVSGQVEWLLKQAMTEGGQSSYQGARPLNITAIWDPVAQEGKPK